MNVHANLGVVLIKEFVLKWIQNIKPTLVAITQAVLHLNITALTDLYHIATVPICSAIYILLHTTQGPFKYL